MSKSGRWTQVEPARLFIGAEGGSVPAPERSGWRTVAILAGIAVGAYVLWPSSESLRQHEEAARGPVERIP